MILIYLPRGLFLKSFGVVPLLNPYGAIHTLCKRDGMSPTPCRTLWHCLPFPGFHYGMASLHSQPYRVAPPSLFLADILKKVIREYKDVYSEIVNRAGRTLQQVWGGGAQRGEDQFPYPPSPPTLC